jgi:hypothetical protein
VDTHSPKDPAISARSLGVCPMDRELGLSRLLSARDHVFGRVRCEALAGPRVEIPGRGVR